MIDLLLLGTGAMVPLPNRWLSCLLVRAGGSLILFDCGEGTQVVWRRFGWGFKRLAAICLTHQHADHVAGLPGLLHTVSNAGRTEPLDIFGPTGTAAVIAGLRVIAPVLPFDVRVHELEPGASFALPDGLRGNVVAGAHSIPVLAYRVERPRAPAFDPAAARALGVPTSAWSALQHGEPVAFEGRQVRPEDVLGLPRQGVAFAFVTDTRPVPAHLDVANGVDLLICEGTYGPSAKIETAIRNGHMTFAEAATIARDADAGELWLTHFGTGMPRPDEFIGEATAVFPRTRIGRTGLAASLTFAHGLEELDPVGG
ncbi:MAG: ribonuclease Z [Chloroflexia bacterium]|nr:ribonuclease Z [Chloroflexia bacterium]